MNLFSFLGFVYVHFIDIQLPFSFTPDGMEIPRSHCKERSNLRGLQ
jgi:hypothetical protein